MRASTPLGSSVGWFGCRRDGQPAGKPDGVAEARDHPAFRGDDDQVLVAHDLGDRRGHLRRDAGRRGGERRGGCGLAEQPVAKSADGQMRDRREGGGIVGVDDQPRDLVVLVGDDRLVEKMRERQVGERHLRRHPLLGASRRRRRPDDRPSAAATPWPAGISDRGRCTASRRSRPHASSPKPFRKPRGPVRRPRGPAPVGRDIRASKSAGDNPHAC